MDGLVMALVLVGLLVAALQPAHSRSWRPGFDSRVDRDRARQDEELRLLSTFEPAAPAERHRFGQTPQPRSGRLTETEALDDPGERGHAA